MNPDFYKSWKNLVPNLPYILQKMEEKTIVGFGIIPYPRIIPALFLRNYIIYSAKDTADIDVLRPYAKIFCLEEKFPKAAQKVHTASYLLGNYGFQAFLKSRRHPFRLMLHRTTPDIVKKLENQHIEWIGNSPESFEDLLLPADFAKTLKEMDLPHLEILRFSKEDFLSKNFADLYNPPWQNFSVKRIYAENVIEQSSFTIQDKFDWEDMLFALSRDAEFKEIQVSPVLDGISASIVGCVTHLGVLTSPLQLHFIDVPEVLHGEPPSGIFLGYDWKYQPWDQQIETKAQQITEKIGNFLSQKGFAGVFGVNFIYDKTIKNIIPMEFNSFFTDAFPVYSLMISSLGKTPPMDFFHLMAQLKIKEDFDFEMVNAKLKERLPLSTIFLRPTGIKEMKIPLKAGIYSYDEENKKLVYERPGAFLWELRNDSEFLMIDSMPRFGKPVIDNVPSLFKLIFPRSIAKSSSEIEPVAGELITVLSTILRENQS
ncbi:MAG: hypothetical protein V1756_01395 [Patescibacteria group bacterium]